VLVQEEEKRTTRPLSLSKTQTQIELSKQEQEKKREESIATVASMHIIRHS
jgi:hypothetical protein